MSAGCWEGNVMAQMPLQAGAKRRREHPDESHASDVPSVCRKAHTTLLQPLTMGRHQRAKRLHTRAIFTQPRSTVNEVLDWNKRRSLPTPLASVASAIFHRSREWPARVPINRFTQSRASSLISEIMPTFSPLSRLARFRHSARPEHRDGRDSAQGCDGVDRPRGQDLANHHHGHYPVLSEGSSWAVTRAL